MKKIVLAILTLILSTAFHGWAIAQTIDSVAAYRPGFTAYTNLDSCKNTVVEADFHSTVGRKYIDNPAFYFYFFDDIFGLKDGVCADGGDEVADVKIKISFLGEPAYERILRWDGNRWRGEGRYRMGPLTVLGAEELRSDTIFDAAQSVFLSEYVDKNGRVPPGVLTAENIEKWASSDSHHEVYLAARLLPVVNEITDSEKVAEAIWFRLYAQNCEGDADTTRRAADLGNPHALYEVIVCIPELYLVQGGHKELSSFPQETQDVFYFYLAKALSIQYLPVLREYRHLVTGGVAARLSPILEAIKERGIGLSFDDYHHNAPDQGNDLPPLEGDVVGLVNDKLMSEFCTRENFASMAAQSGSIFNMIAAAAPGAVELADGRCRLNLIDGYFRFGISHVDNLSCSGVAGRFECSFVYYLSCMAHFNSSDFSSDNNPVCNMLQSLPNPAEATITRKEAGFALEDLRIAGR